jgi:hypothetical protein
MTNTFKFIVPSTFALALICGFLATAETGGRLLSGDIGVSSRWRSGWLDLDTVTDFQKGDRLEIEIGGTAQRILVRLLPKGESPDESIGIIGGVVEVPVDRRVTVTIPDTWKDVVQISVHGGPNPWNRGLGHNNGPATLVSARLFHTIASRG